MDFSLSDDLVELKERTERFVREQIIPLRKRQAADAARAEPRSSAASWWRSARAGRAAVAACRPRMGRARARPSRQGGGVRGGRLFAARADRDELLRPRRSQHAPARTGRRGAPEGGMAAPARRRRDPLVLYDDRAGARRRVRPVDAADDGAPRHRRQSRRFCHRRREMADHRRGRRRIRDHHGEERQRRARPGRRDDVPRADGRAGHPYRARARHARRVHGRRPRGDPARRAARAGKRGARPGRARASAMPRRGSPRRG